MWDFLLGFLLVLFFPELKKFSPWVDAVTSKFSVGQLNNGERCSDLVRLYRIASELATVNRLMSPNFHFWLLDWFGFGGWFSWYERYNSSNNRGAVEHDFLKFTKIVQFSGFPRTSPVLYFKGQKLKGFWRFYAFSSSWMSHFSWYVLFLALWFWAVI